MTEAIIPIKEHVVAQNNKLVSNIAGTMFASFKSDLKEVQEFHGTNDEGTYDKIHHDLFLPDGNTVSLELYLEDYIKDQPILNSENSVLNISLKGSDDRPGFTCNLTLSGKIQELFIIHPHLSRHQLIYFENEFDTRQGPDAEMKLLKLLNGFLGIAESALILGQEQTKHFKSLKDIL